MGAKNNDSRPCLGASVIPQSAVFKGICSKCKNDSIRAEIVSIWTRNMLVKDGRAEMMEGFPCLYFCLCVWDMCHKSFIINGMAAISIVRTGK